MSEKLQNAGIHRIIVPGVSASQWQRQIAHCQNIKGCYLAFGIHPWWIEDATENDLSVLANLLNRQERVVAVGEIGLDAKIVNIDKQIHFFEQQLVLARQQSLPVIVHHRQTHHLILPILRKQALTGSGVIHAFSGSYQQAMQYIELGYKLGIGGVISYERAKKTRKAVSQLPLSSLVIETDAPSMPLSGQQGQPNSPANLIRVFNELCQLRDETPQQVAWQLEQNCESLFTF